MYCSAEVHYIAFYLLALRDVFSKVYEYFVFLERVKNPSAKPPFLEGSRKVALF